MTLDAAARRVAKDRGQGEDVQAGDTGPVRPLLAPDEDEGHVQSPGASEAPVRGMAVVPGRFITPATSVDEAVHAFEQYQSLKNQLGKPEDFQEIGGRRFPKKSFVRKIQRFFALSNPDVVRDEPYRDDEGRTVGWLCTARVSHPGGAEQTGDGSCEFNEKACREHLPTLDSGCKRCLSNATLHNVRAHAMTRAKNRAIMDLVGFGDVTADEMPPGGGSGSGGASGQRAGRKFKHGDQGFGECPEHPGWYFEAVGQNNEPAHPVEGQKRSDGKPAWCNKRDVIGDERRPTPAPEPGPVSPYVGMACPRHTGAKFTPTGDHEIVNTETGVLSGQRCVAEKLLADSKAYAEKYLWNLDAESVEPFDEHDWLLAHAPGCADKPKETWGLAEWYAVADAIHGLLTAEGPTEGSESDE